MDILSEIIDEKKFSGLKKYPFYFGRIPEDRSEEDKKAFADSILKAQEEHVEYLTNLTFKILLVKDFINRMSILGTQDRECTHNID